MPCSTCLFGASAAPHAAVKSVRVSASSRIGSVGQNVLWPSKLPKNGKHVFSSETSFLANGGTTIEMGKHTKTFPAHSSFFQMSRHDISHLLSVIANESAKPPSERTPAPCYFDATIEGEVSADFVDGLMESVVEYQETPSGPSMRGALDWAWREVSHPEHYALSQLFGESPPAQFLFVPPSLTLTMIPQNLVAYTVWDTICDNLKLSLHLLPHYVKAWGTLEEFHAYAEFDLAQDIAAFAAAGQESPALLGLRKFVEENYHGLVLNYAAMFSAAKEALGAWHTFFAHSALSGSLDKGFFFARGSRFDTAYVMSKCAHAALICPVDAPTIQLRPELYVDHPRATARYKKGARILERIVKQLTANEVNASSREILLGRLHRLGQISYGVTILPTLLNPDEKRNGPGCRKRCSASASSN